MNNLVNVTSHKVETMSSTELSDLLNYEKKEVNKKIRAMFEAEIAGGEISLALDSQGRVSEYHLNELYSTMFVGRWNNPFLRKLAQFWIDRKNDKPALPDFTNPAEAARAWATEFEQKQIALEKIEADKPKVEFAESISSSVNSFDLSEASKRLKVKGLGPNKLRAWLRQNGVLMRDNKPYQKFMDGRFEIETRVRTNIDGEKESYFVTMITPRGFIWLEKVVRKHWEK